MSNSAPIHDLRRQIDSIDIAIHDLLMERTEVVGAIAAAKAGNGEGCSDAGPMRPAREAEILRNLAERHRGALPLEVIVRIWRELMAAMTRLQGPLQVAVYGGRHPLHYWDLARFQYGSATPMTLLRSPREVIRAVVEGNGVVGVLPFDGEDDASPWWTHLLAGSEGRCPRIVARLPFLCPPGEQSLEAEAVAVSLAEQEPTGKDTSYAIVAAEGTIARTSLGRRLTETGLPGRIIASHDDAQLRQRLHLVEIAEFVAPGDPRLLALTTTAGPGILQARVIGGYADPLHVGASETPAVVS